MLEVESGQKIREAHQVLYKAMTDRLQQVAEIYERQLHEVRLHCREQMETKVHDKWAMLVERNYNVLIELEEKHQIEIEEKQVQLEKASKNFRIKDEERQKMKFTEARYYLLLKKNNLLDPEVCS
jgi:phosphotransacetylase